MAVTSGTLLTGFSKSSNTKNKAKETSTNGEAESLRHVYEARPDHIPEDLSADQVRFIQMMNGVNMRVADLANRSVVYIRSDTHISHDSMGNPSEEMANPLEKFHEEFLNRFFGQKQSYRADEDGKESFQKTASNYGSGFFVSEDGLIVTNFHVVKNAQSIQVGNPGWDEEFEAKVLLHDQKTDIALLKIISDEARSFPFLELADSDLVDSGEFVIAAGSPSKLNNSISAGIISSTDRRYLNINELEDFFQTDAAINPGNSGGPLFNLYGKVIGVNSAILSRTGANSGIGFAIKSNVVRSIIHQYAHTGSLSRGFLGVQLQALTPELGQQFNYCNKKGVLISDVVAGSPADKAGLQAGDIIYEVDGHVVDSPEKVRNRVQLYAKGQKVNFVVYRNGKRHSIDVTLGSNEPESKVRTQVEQKLGFSIENITPELRKRFDLAKGDEGVVITDVQPSSSAYQMGLRPGQVLMQVDHQGVATVEEVEDIVDGLNSSKQVLILVRHKQGVRFMTLRLSNASK